MLVEDLKRIYMTDTGRLNRIDYFKYSVILGIAAIIVITILEEIFKDDFGGMGLFGKIVYLAVSLASLIPAYFLDIRRLHDCGYDVTLARVNFVLCANFCVPSFDVNTDTPFNTIVSLAVLLLGAFILFKPGTPGENQYGV